MRIMEGFCVLPQFDICWYQWKGRKHYFVTLAWFFWYWTSLKEFEWDKKGGEI